MDYLSFAAYCKFEINDKVCLLCDKGKDQELYQVWDIFSISSLRDRTTKFIIRIIDIDGTNYLDVAENELVFYNK